MEGVSEPAGKGNSEGWLAPVIPLKTSKPNELELCRKQNKVLREHGKVLVLFCFYFPWYFFQSLLAKKQ